MKKVCLVFFVAILTISIVLPSPVARAQSSLPHVPVTFPGDTDDTIKRRAQWIEGAKKEGALNWWGSRRPEEGNKILSEFTRVYPFLSGSYWRGRGEEVASKLEAEHAGGRISVDIAVGGEPYNYPRWRKMGILEKFSDIIPAIKKWNTSMYGKQGDWVRPGNNGVVPMYNTRLLSGAEAPKSWEDLLDPKWERQLALETDMDSWEVLALAEGGWGVEKTSDFLNRIKRQKPIWVSGGTAGYTLLMAGEFKIFINASLRNYLQTREKNVPVEWVRANPVPIIGASFILLKKAPHPNAARLFLEWMLSPQGLALYEDVTSLGAAFPGAGTRMSKLLEGMSFAYQTEEMVLEAVQSGLAAKFARIMGIGH